MKVRVCEHCGARVYGEICEYCDMPIAEETVFLQPLSYDSPKVYSSPEQQQRQKSVSTVSLDPNKKFGFGKFISLLTAAAAILIHIK